MRIVNFVAALCLSSGVMPAVVASGTYDEASRKGGFQKLSGHLVHGQDERQLKDSQKPNLRGLSWWADGDVDPNAGEGKTTKLVESVPCEPEHSRAVDFVQAYGDLNAGNAACAAEADPDSCGGGCCRFGAFFVCDEENQMAHLPCVCNRNTQDPKDYVAAFAAPESARDGEGTGSSTMQELVGTIVDNNAPESPKSGNESSSTGDSVAADDAEGGIDVDAGVDDEDAKSPLDAIWDFFFGDDEDTGANSTSASNTSTSIGETNASEVAPLSFVSVSKTDSTEVESTKPASAGTANASAVASPRSGELDAIVKGVSGAVTGGAEAVTSGAKVVTNTVTSAIPRTGENPLDTIVNGVSGAVTGGAEAVSSGAKAVTNTVTSAIPKSGENHTETGNSTVKCGNDEGTSPKDGESNSTGTDGEDESTTSGEGNETLIDVDDEDEDTTGGNATAPKDGENPLDTIVNRVSGAVTGGAEAVSSGAKVVTNTVASAIPKSGENHTETGNSTVKCGDDEGDSPKDGESNSTETGGGDEATTSGEGNAPLIDVDDESGENVTDDSEQPKMGMPWDNLSMPWDDPESGENATAPKDGENPLDTIVNGVSGAVTGGAEAVSSGAKVVTNTVASAIPKSGENHTETGDSTVKCGDDEGDSPKDGESNSTETGGGDEATTSGEGNATLIDVGNEDEDSTDNSEQPKMGFSMPWNLSMPWDNPASGENATTPKDGEGNSTETGGGDEATTNGEGNSTLIDVDDEDEDPKAGDPLKDIGFTDSASSGGSDGSNSTDGIEAPKKGDSLLDQMAGPFTSVLPKSGVAVPDDILNATAEEEPKEGSFLDTISDPVKNLIPKSGVAVPDDILNATAEEEPKEGSFLDTITDPVKNLIPKSGVAVPDDILNATAEEEPKEGSLLDQMAGPFTSVLPKAGVPVPEEIRNATAEEPSFIDKISDAVKSVIPGLGGNATKAEEEEEELEVVEEELEAVEKAAEELKELIEAEPAD